MIVTDGDVTTPDLALSAFEQAKVLKKNFICLQEGNLTRSMGSSLIKLFQYRPSFWKIIFSNRKGVNYVDSFLTDCHHFIYTVEHGRIDSVCKEFSSFTIR